ncbi:scavenger receptor cysteine-rich type 1 protein M130 isoform X2 [Micropterus dolomieu]|uniref:scavenger receptor cysteine-rich type 1 protein M130 isoform X2 n=1 Tax=Micropterus dolomieu TaxID=147949 RepID=UPI001E8D3DA9|nr:scavenger receptor cysteine-rich type 1 protein M130 isoform X2 [Micropterus dolomieu]
MMWFLLFLCIAHIEPVILQDENRLILRDGSRPCEGHVEIYHEKKWGYVGDKGWNRATEEVVCKSINCGEPMEDLTVDVKWPFDSSTVWLNELKCNENHKNLWDCNFPGWNISFYKKWTVKKITCRNNISISLDGYDCAGAVQFSINGKKSYFCDLGEREANFLCKSLNCSASKEIIKEEWMGWKHLQNSEMTLNCAGINDVQNLWQCAKQGPQVCKNPVSVICKGHKRLQLEGDPSNVCSGNLQTMENGKWTYNNSKSSLNVCRQMNCGTVYKQTGDKVTCTDNIKVVLRENNNPSTCYGAVHIQVNTSLLPVCGNSWTEKNAEVVCKELNCGKVVTFDETKKKTTTRGIMDYVKCSGEESSLWHCRAKRDKTPFTCDSMAYVVCAASIDVRLADGPGKCAGRVEIKHKGQWKRVRKSNWKETNSDAVCSQLKCGNKGKSNSSEKFSKGSGGFLDNKVDCSGNAANINECFEKNQQHSDKEDEPVGIICEDHKVVFLSGEKACSGIVGIEHGTKTHWLSGSNETWNQYSANAVCQQMHCGKATQYNFIDSKMFNEGVWKESYSCLPNTKSLFECENRTLPSNHSDTIASVTCSGKIEINLANQCYGRVNVCVNETCGGVCADTWTEQMSLMLCKDLGCGDKILHLQQKKHEISNVIIQSLHTTQHTTKVNQCNLVRSAENGEACENKAAYVACSGSVKAEMSNAEMSSSYTCYGSVTLHYDGQWLPVCTAALNDMETRNAICGDLKCGHALNVTDFGPSVRGQVISEMNCSANGKESLQACNITSATNTCTHGFLKCAGWSQMMVEGDKSCSGNVLVFSERVNMTAFPPDKWTDTTGNKFCQDLECGNLKSKKTITLQQQQRLFIECEDEHMINLSDKCHGDVKINGIEVCDSDWDWDKIESHFICQAQNCSNAVVGIPSVRMPNPAVAYHHFKCEEHHYKLSQCLHFKGKCNRKLMSVYCTENVKFNTTEKCGGQIEVNYRNKWEKVCPLNSSFTSEFKEMLCKNLNCGGLALKIQNNNNKKTDTLETHLHCTTDHMDIKHCVIHEHCSNVVPAEIYCTGYVIKPPPKEIRKPISIVPILLGVGLLLVLVIVIVVFIRIFIVKKAKNVSSRMFPRQEVEFESGDYEDVKSKENEMEESHRGRFRSEAEVITESDTRSNASFSYDDIDEAAEAQPLTSKAATAGPTDEVTYEVEDPQENYDDIEASPEISQTKVEVHDSPQTTPESIAAASPALVQEDEDYLVPGHDG